MDDFEAGSDYGGLRFFPEAKTGQRRRVRGLKWNLTEKSRYRVYDKGSGEYSL